MYGFYTRDCSSQLKIRNAGFAFVTRFAVLAFRKWGQHCESGVSTVKVGSALGKWGDSIEFGRPNSNMPEDLPVLNTLSLL